MELRVLQYFLAIAREESISRAAESLHLSQPTLSRQLKALEDELGKQLVVRGSHSVTLTEEGMILRRRAEEILDLVRRAEDEISLEMEDVAGEIRIAAGETDGIRLFADVMQTMKREYPGVTYQFQSGNSVYVREQLDKGLADFGLVYEEVDPLGYDSLPVPIVDEWGVMVRRDSPLAEKRVVAPKDLLDQPLILSGQTSAKNQVAEWFGKSWKSVNILATYNLSTNAAILASTGVGCVVCFNKLLRTSGDSELCFRPLSPPLTSQAALIWKKYQPLGKAPRKFLELLRESIS